MSERAHSSEIRTLQFQAPIENPGRKRRPALLVLRGAQAGLRVNLAQESVTLGRSPGTDLVLDDDRVSRLHAEIVPQRGGGAFRIVDLESTNGTYVNGRAVRRARLSDGDKIFVGSTILKFVIEDRVDSEGGELIERLVFEDDLTGLVVRRRFDSDLRVCMGSALSTGRKLSLLMMDLDGLKQINDLHGHAAGALVISQAGRRIGEICNTRGEACRIGGDEFVAYLLDAGRAQALELGAHICESIRRQDFRVDGISLRVSISVGAASFPEDGDSRDTLTRAADAALYRAKERGRDTVSA